MPAKKDAASELAVKMVQTLRQREARGESDSPLTLEQLAKSVDPAASTKTILSAVIPQRKAFSLHAIAARKDLRAPVALHEDLPLLVASPILLQLLLNCARTASNHASSPAELKSKLTSKLRGAFQESVNRRIAERSLLAKVLQR